MRPESRVTTRDQPAPGLVVHQPRRGFRYAMEPFLLAGWLMERHAGQRVLDVGTGSGIIALLLARAGFSVGGIDVLPEWIDLARRSARDSGLNIDFRVADVRDLAGSGGFDLAISNPPFFPLGSGPVPRDRFRAAGRHELAGDLRAIVAAMAGQAPTLALVLPRARADDAQAALEAAGRSTRFRCDVGQTFVLLEGRAGTGPVHIESVPCQRGGRTSARVAGWYAAVGSHAQRAG